MFTGPDIVTDGLVLALDAANVKSYPGSGTTWYDLSGNGNNGILQNGVAFSQGKLILDNTDDRISIPGIDYDDLASSGDFTIIIIGKKTAYGTSGNNTGNSTLFHGAGSGYTFGWRIIETNTGTPNDPFSSPHSILMALPQTHSSRIVSDNVYRPFYYAFSFTNGDTGLAFLNENISQGSNTYGTGGTSFGLVSYTSYGVGSWGGDINSIIIYNRGLSLSEIQQNYNATKSRFNL